MRFRVAALLATSALEILWSPVVISAQPGAKALRIGVLVGSGPSVASPNVEAFRRGLRDLGYVEGRNIAIEVRWAEGRLERFPEFVAELLSLKVDILVAGTVAAALAARQATTTIPIVLTVGDGAVGTGLAASLARPGGRLPDLARELGPARAGRDRTSDATG